MPMPPVTGFVPILIPILRFAPSCIVRMILGVKLVAVLVQGLVDLLEHANIIAGTSTGQTESGIAKRLSLQQKQNVFVPMPTRVIVPVGVPGVLATPKLASGMKPVFVYETEPFIKSVNAALIRSPNPAPTLIPNLLPLLLFLLHLLPLLLFPFMISTLPNP